MAALVGCGDAESIAVDAYEGTYAGGAAYGAETTDRNLMAEATLTDEGQLAVTLWGSSSCPDVPIEVESPQPGELWVEFRADDDQDCTDDLAPTTSIIDSPDGVEPPLLVTIDAPVVDEVSGGDEQELVIKIPEP